MSTWPKISIVVPSFNQGAFIGATLRSIFRQEYPNLEVIVQDGGSQDQTVSVLKKFGSRIRWESKPDGGQTEAINTGLAKATGQIMMYLNSDDCLADGALFAIAQAFQKHPTALWVTGEYRIMDAQGKTREGLARWYKRVQRDVLRVFPGLWTLVLSINNPIIQPSTAWRRELWEQVGLFDESLRFTMDYDWWWRALRVGTPVILPKLLSHFRVHGSSKGGSAFTKQFAEQEMVASNHTFRFTKTLQHIHNKVILFFYQQWRS